jgi:uncharacterized protein (TIGR03118 family)
MEHDGPTTARPGALRRRWAGIAGAGAAALVLGIPIGLLPAASAEPSGSPAAVSFVQTNLVSNIDTVGALIPDQNLQNPWGLALSPASPLWVADNNSGKATLYSIGVGGRTVSKLGLTVTVPGGRASTGDGSSPTGQVFNPTTGFVVTTPDGTGPAFFIFDSESGQLTAWSPAADPVSAGGSTGTLEYSSPSAVYKGLAIASGDNGTFLYAANFHDATVDVFDSNFHLTHLAGNFDDPDIPVGYAPFGIQNIHNLIYVTYAKQDALAHDDVPGPGHGFVDIYTTDGFLVQRLVSRGPLNSPWGMVVAPSSFGRFAGMLLVGNFGNGHINVFNPFSGRFLGQLEGSNHFPLDIPDLWGLKVGTSSTGGTQTVLFSAGIDHENDGLLGSINAQSK